MNHYTYSDIKIGDEEIFTHEITEDQMRLFLEITGDTNSLHADEKRALEEGYKGRVVYGMLTASLLSTLAGVYMPGEYSLINSEELFFVKPVYVGDILQIKGKVYEKNDKFNIITLKVSITNQNNEKVCRGKMEITVRQ